MPIAVVRAQVSFQKRATLTVRAHRSELLQGFLRALMTLMTSITAPFGTSSLKRDKPVEGCPRKGYKEYRMCPLLSDVRGRSSHIIVRDILPTDIGTFLKDVTSFDNVEFGISSKDTLSMSSSTRRSIEMSFLALLDSGIDSRRQKVGTFCAGTNAEASDLVS